MPLINKQAKTNPNSWKDTKQKRWRLSCRGNAAGRSWGGVETHLQERNDQRRHDHPLDVLLQKLNHGVMATLKHQTSDSVRSGFP